MTNLKHTLLDRLLPFAFVLLLLVVIILLGWVFERYHHEFDLTWGNRNSLTDASTKILKQLDKQVTITAFVRDDSIGTRDIITELVERYRRHKTDIELKFLNPDLVPQLVREHGISVDGELLIGYGARQEKLQSISEKALTQTLLRLSSDANNFIVFIEGHGERSATGQANHDMGQFGQKLAAQGYQLQSINLASTLSIPTNTRVLVIASPQVALLPGEVELIELYINAGGNLLWLTEPQSSDGLEKLAAGLDLRRLPGIVVDATTQLFGIADPTFALAIEYPNHPVTRHLHSQTLFPQAVGLASAEDSDWETTPLISTLPRSWTEMDANGREIRFDEGTEERAGPIDIAVTAERSIANSASDDNQANTGEPGNDIKQRIIVVGDGDFLANQYLGNGQNLDLGLAMFKWLSLNDNQIDIGQVGAPDTQLDISQPGAITLLLVFLIALPLALLLTGLLIWLKRRNR